MTSGALPSVSVVIPCYNNSQQAVRTATSLLELSLPLTNNPDIIVVDDGSKPSHILFLQQRLPKEVRLVSLPQNSGRSLARNIGASHARHQYLIFLDSDCTPGSPDFLNAHLNTLNKGAVASIGSIKVQNNDLWGIYQTRAWQRNHQRYLKGIYYSGSSANLGVRAPEFFLSGKFNEDLIGYGFEDRELLIRLAEFGPIEWNTEASVFHKAKIDLDDFCRKMKNAGESNSKIFSRNHPKEYRELGYARIDARTNRLLRLVLKTWPTLPQAAKWATKIAMDSAHIPKEIKMKMISTSAALHFALGTINSLK